MFHEVLASAAREVYNVARATTATHRRLRDHLTAILVATLGVDLVCALIAFLVERHSPETDLDTFGSAFFWTSTQLLTVSSSIKNPISSGGRVLDIFMEIWAITVIATLAGAIGSFLQRRGEEIDAKGHTQ
jgi:branched-subunit amino acid ABC-type transport system permease component